MIARTSVGWVSRQACACSSAVGSCLAIARMILARLPRSALAALLKRGIVSTGAYGCICGCDSTASAGGVGAVSSGRWLTRGSASVGTVVVVGVGLGVDALARVGVGTAVGVGGDAVQDGAAGDCAAAGRVEPSAWRWIASGWGRRSGVSALRNV